MLSRVAERIYWLGRYLERGENTARLVNVNTLLLLDLPRRVPLGWQPLIDITGNAELFAEHLSETSERNVVRFLVADEKNPGSLLSSLHSARENARTIRDALPREGWERINDLYLQAKAELPSGLARSRRYDKLVGVIAACQQVTGLLAGAMLHDEGYDFLRIGRNLERADMTTRIVDVRTAPAHPDIQGVELEPFRHAQWLSLLRSISAYQAYWLKVQAPVRRREVLEFLFKERQFPRSILHGIGEVATAIGHLPRSEALTAEVNALALRIEKRRVGRMDDDAVHAFVDRLQLNLARLHKAIATNYFQIGAVEQRPRRPRSRKKPVETVAQN
ncbi:hypothetical protein BI364_03245 [Acidihalobacter yilgarnensis]|uniref:DUF403 domain-containing protein n=1 Tax=Acidihalobacter yilgarnensis TaxID=2819280 RepID=A0A1D8IKZ2_9GAMM|nr:alpha-E domain-containing protein [Acidihalobacter yilgarnensis]AOU97148.1 hypothetical protein BI364_03245 [Acidihalobacter yilgarnensis]